MTISNVYKPPWVQWALPALPIYAHPEVRIGDFNSHHSNWGYGNSDEAGEQLMNWFLSSDHYLYFDTKQPGNFLSARWRIVSNPDLCFVSRDCQGRPLHTSCKTLSQFPHSQHRPILVNIGIEIPLFTSKYNAGTSGKLTGKNIQLK